ncbi:HrpZ protein|uniref:HrpZ protein n=1 Tax=Brenneria salicis ATCC 15712 = DSM 30166 TaxID=714314 RepID=A0A366I9X3_9GAMM|nr:type III secretion protein HrpN [Brenneria salicis]NMN91767.1 HrpZ protein [Brenneria salicis ATCC 15712 = DSM 30166]RBP65834.1 HrpZ protein [Brenneria salicis ATCC 15712 = DSM 30166]RLM31869.1 type III secretion protein HrpN [Brenneria salicis ATCC 15712 = DSM 30166]
MITSLGGGTSLQVTIKTDGNNGLSSAKNHSHGGNALQNAVSDALNPNKIAEQLADLMTSMLFMGGMNGAGMMGGMNGAGMMGGLGLAGGLASGLGSGLGLASGLGGGLANGLGSGLGLASGLGGGLANGLSSGLGLAGGLASGLGGGLASGLGGGLAGGLASGLGGGLAGGLATGLGGSLVGGLANGLGSALNTGMNAMNPSMMMGNLMLQALDDMLGGLSQLQNGMGGLFGNKTPSSPEISAYTQGAKDMLTAISGGGLSQAQGSQTPLQLNNNGLQGLSGADSFNQLGSAMGLSVSQKAGLQELNSVSSYGLGKNRYYIEKEDRQTAKQVGEFMDQYPEVFGKPHHQKDKWDTSKQDNKSWARALSKPGDDGMTKESMDQFTKAAGMIKSAVAGDTGNANLQARGMGGSSMGIDASIVGDRFVNMGLKKMAW